MEEEKGETKKSVYLQRILYILAILFCAIGFLTPLIIKSHYGYKGMTLDQISTWIGAASSPFFSIASLILIVATIMVQREELENQRKELELTRDEFKTQNNTLKVQKFENTFFNLLNLHQEIVNRLSFKEPLSRPKLTVPGYEEYIKEYSGTEYFKRIFESLKIFYETLVIKEDRNSITGLNEAYKAFFKEVEQDLGHYFRYLYHIVKFIDSAEGINETEKHEYAAILRAQLSTFELVLLFYNSISEYGIQKFKPLITKYDLLQQLPDDRLLSLEHKKFYHNKD